RSVPKDRMGSSKVVKVAANPYGVYAATMNTDLVIFPQGNPKDMRILPDICAYGKLPSLNRWGPYIIAYNGSLNRNLFKDSVLLKKPPFAYSTNFYRNDDRSGFLWNHFIKIFTLVSGSGDSI